MAIRFHIHHVVVESIFEHLSGRARREWKRRYICVSSGIGLSDQDIWIAWYQVCRRLFLDPEHGCLLDVKGRDREAIERVADLYLKKAHHEDNQAEWHGAQEFAFRVIRSGTRWKNFRAYRLYLLWLAVLLAAGVCALFFGIREGGIVLSWPTLIAGTVAVWAAGRAESARGAERLPVEIRNLSVIMAWQAAKYYGESPIGREFAEKAQFGEEYTAEEAHVLEVLKTAEELAAIRSARACAKFLGDSATSIETAAKQRFWRWLAEVFLDALCERCHALDRPSFEQSPP